MFFLLINFFLESDAIEMIFYSINHWSLYQADWDKSNLILLTSDLISVIKLSRGHCSVQFINVINEEHRQIVKISLINKIFKNAFSNTFDCKFLTVVSSCLISTLFHANTFFTNLTKFFSNFYRLNSVLRTHSLETVFNLEWLLWNTLCRKFEYFVIFILQFQ